MAEVTGKSETVEVFVSNDELFGLIDAEWEPGWTVTNVYRATKTHIKDGEEQPQIHGLTLEVTRTA